MAELDEAVDEAEAHRVEAETRSEELAMLLIGALVDGFEPSESQLTKLADLAGAGATASALALVWPLLGARARVADLPPGSKPHTFLEEGPLRDAVEAAAVSTSELLEAQIQRVASEAKGVAPDMSQADRRSIARSLGVSIATEATSHAAMVMAPAVAAYLDAVVKKMWISRGDVNVRESHRLLHAETADVDDSFKPGLRYPGDPQAPPDERINCRCGLFLVPAEQASAAEDALHIDPAAFDESLAAGGNMRVYRLGGGNAPRHEVSDQIMTSQTWSRR